MLSKVKDATMEKLWTWGNIYGIDADEDAYLGADKCINF